MSAYRNDPQATDALIKTLRRLTLFKGIEYSALRALVSASRVYKVGKGREAFAEGDPARSGLALVSGRLRLTTRAGADTILAAPALIGEQALILESLRPFTAIATTEVGLVEIPRGSFLRLVAEFPSLATPLRQRILHRLNWMIDTLEAVRLDLDAPPRFDPDGWD